MTTPITVEWGGGTFRARDGAGTATEGPTLADALARLEAAAGPPMPPLPPVPPPVIHPLPPPAPGENPLAAIGGWLKDNPMFDEYLRCIAENRRLNNEAEGLP